MLVINESLNSGGDLLGSELESHLVDHIVKSLSSHSVFLDLILIRVVKSLSNTLL